MVTLIIFFLIVVAFSDFFGGLFVLLLIGGGFAGGIWWLAHAYPTSAAWPIAGTALVVFGYGYPVVLLIRYLKRRWRRHGPLARAQHWI